MKILITGAYGFVGTNLCRYLAGRGHECWALDVEGARRSEVPYARVFGWDELDELGRALEDGGVDAVVHLAGKAHDLKKVSDEKSYFDVNVGLTEKIFGVCEGKVKRFVYFSSSKAAEAQTPYGRSKLAAEEFLAGRAIVLRPAMIHGPGNKGNLNLLWGVARRGVPWPLAAWENGRSFASIGNVCAAVEALCERGEKGIYGMADDETLSTNRIVELMAEACGRKARLWRVPRGVMRWAARAGDVIGLPLDSERLGKLTEDSRVDNGALKASLGWERMPVRAEAGMRETLASFSREKREGGKMYKMVKRGLDVVLSGVAILLLAPLFLPVMAILKCTGEHDIFYGQERIGLGRRRFKIWKFATMLRNSPNMAGGMHTRRGDPRVLPFGRMLRKAKINELPQVFNIFLGDMSIVGPRPLVDKTFAPYPEEVKARIYSVRPGLTGIGSIVFRDEEAILSESKLDVEECYAKEIAPYKGALEMWYLEHVGFWTDLKLVFLTAWVVVFPESRLVERMFKDLPKRAAFTQENSAG